MTNHASKERFADRFAVVLKFFPRYKGLLILGGISVLAANWFKFRIPKLIGKVIDFLADGQPMELVGKWVLVILVLAVASGIFRFLMRRTVIWASRSIEYDLRGELKRKLLSLSPSYYDRTRTGDIMARTTNDLEAVRMMIGPGIMQLSNTVVSVVVALWYLIDYSPKLTLYALAPALLLPFVMNRLGNLVHKRFMRIQEKFSELTAVAQENLSGMRVVKAYGQEEPEIAGFSTHSREYLDYNMDMARLYSWFFPIIMGIGGSLNLVVLYFGGLEYIGGDITLGALNAFFLYLMNLIWPLMAIGWVISLYQRGTASLARINAILRSEPDVADTAESPHRGTIKGKIDLVDLTFAYDNTPVLQGINMSIKPGETVGLVGMTGSGKTSLVSLLARLYPVPHGQLFVDDIDINDWELDALRRQIGFATQESFLFSSTIADNIRFGDEAADMERVTDAAHAAALSKDVETFPQAYDTMVGERGITLSGGQKQRAAIARAVLRRPAILILDDATSSVDTETEHEINERIQGKIEDLTTIIISHRVASVKDADRILYLEDGRIVEHGSHDELLAADGRYASLYRSQLLEQEIASLQ